MSPLGFEPTNLGMIDKRHRDRQLRFSVSQKAFERTKLWMAHFDTSSKVAYIVKYHQILTTKCYFPDITENVMFSPICYI